MLINCDICEPLSEYTMPIGGEAVLSKAFDVVFGVSILASLVLYRIRPRPGIDKGGTPASLPPKIPAKDPRTDAAPGKFL